MDKLSNSMSITSSKIDIQKYDYVISGLHIFGSRGSNNPIIWSSYAHNTVICFDTYTPTDVFFAIFVERIWFQSMHDFSFKLSKAYDGQHS